MRDKADYVRVLQQLSYDQTWFSEFMKPQAQRVATN